MSKHTPGPMCSVPLGIVVGPRTWKHMPGTCSRKGKVQRDGKWYCGQHDPEAVAERDRKRREKFNAEMAIKHKKRALERAAPDLLAALKGVLAFVADKADAHGFHMDHESDVDRACAAIAKAEGDTP